MLGRSSKKLPGASDIQFYILGGKKRKEKESTFNCVAIFLPSVIFHPAGEHLQLLVALLISELLFETNASISLKSAKPVPLAFVLSSQTEAIKRVKCTNGLLKNKPPP